MKFCIAVAILCAAVFCEARVQDELRRRRQVDLDTILDVFGQPPAGNQGNQFGQGGNQFGQGGNQFGQGGNQFGQGGGQFGQPGGQFGQPGGQLGQPGGQFGQGGGQFGQPGGQFGQGGNQFGQGGNQFGQGGNQFGQGGNQFGQGTDPLGNNQFGAPTSTNAPVDNTPTTTTQSPRVRQCIANCQTTSQYSPVCGSNGIQYMNMERLNCARRCGVDVRPLQRGSNC